jgi:DNA-binding transcriptional ArsR family regulator
MAESGRATRDGTTPRSILETLAGTPLRLRVLDALSGGDLDLRDLSDRTNIPRTTLRHNLSRLLEAGVIEETRTGAYCLTPRGRIARTGIEAYRTRIETGIRLEPFFECVPIEEIDAEIGWFADAEMTVSGRSSPYAPGRRLLTVLDTPDPVRGYLPSLPAPPGGELGPVLDRGERDIVVTADVADRLGGAAAAVTEVEGVSITVTAEDLPYGGLSIDGERALLLGLDERGKPHVTLETEREECVAWIEREQESYREAASSV